MSACLEDRGVVNLIQDEYGYGQPVAPAHDRGHERAQALCGHAEDQGKPILLVRPQRPIDRRTADAEGLRDFRGSKPPRLEFAHPCRVYRGRPALVETPAALAFAILKLVWRGDKVWQQDTR